MNKTYADHSFIKILKLKQGMAGISCTVIYVLNVIYIIYDLSINYAYM